MNIRFVLAVVITAVVTFFLGWLVFGILLANFYTSQMSAAAKPLLKNPPEFWAIILGNLVLAFLLALIFDHYANIRSATQGAIAGAVISFLMVLGFDLFLYGQMSMFNNLQIVLIDPIINGIFGLIPGALIACILGYKRETS